MNLKRYIDAAVRREIRKIFFKDIDASGLIRNVKRLFMMGVQHSINKWKSAPPDSLGPHQIEYTVQGGYKNLMFKKPFSTGVKELRKLYDFLYSSRISQI